MEQNSIEDDEDTMAGVYNAWSKWFISKYTTRKHTNTRHSTHTQIRFHLIDIFHLYAIFWLYVNLYKWENNIIPT